MFAVLYVDDEPGLLELGKIFLEQSGQFTVDTALSAQDGLAILREKSADCIVSDYQMPGMDGLAFLKTIREGNNPIPFILFTGRGREEVVIEALNNGADYYLQKGGDPTSQFAELSHKILRAVEHRRTMRALVDSERRFRDLTENSLDTIMLFDRNLRHLYVNPNAEVQTGIPPARFIGKTHAELGFPQDLAELWQRTLTDVFESGRNRRIEFRFPSGPWIDWLLVPVHAPDGSVVQVITSARDITERKRAEADLRKKTLEAEESYSRLKKVEQVLRESQERLRTFMDSATDAFTIWDSGLNLIDLNPSALSYLPPGTRKEDVLGKNYLDFMPGSQKSGEYDRYLEVMRTGIPFFGSEMVPDPQYGERWLNARIFRVGSGLGIVTTDITQQKKAEEELRGAYEQLSASDEELRAQYEVLASSEQKIRESEERLRSFINSTRDSVVIIDEEGIIVEWNRSSEQISGIARVDALGSCVWDIFFRLVPRESRTEERRAALEQMMRTALRTGVPVSAEPRVSEIEHTDGKRLVIRQVVFPIRTEKGFWFGFIAQDITKERRAEEALRESEEKYRTFMEASTDGALLIEEGGRILTWNPAAERIFGVTEKDAIGMDILDLNFRSVVPEHRSPAELEGLRSRFAVEFSALFQRTSPLSIEVEIVNARGRIRTIQQMLFPISTAQGRRIGCIVRDITDQRAAEKNLRESERLYRSVIENVQDVYYRSDREGNLIMASPSGAALLGYESIDEILGKPVAETFYFDPAERTAFFAELEKTGSVSNFDTRLKKKDGSVVYVSTNSHYYQDQFGAVVGVEGIIRDITDRKRAEDALRESEERYRTLIETSPDPIIMYDLGGKMLSANAEAARVYGNDSVGEFLSEVKSVFDVLTEDGKAFAAANFRRTLKGGVSQKNEYTVRRRDGSTVSVEINSSVVKSATGEPAAFISVIRDITDRKRAEDALRESEERFRALVETSPDMLWEIDLRGIFRYISPRVRDILGFEPSELTGRPVLLLVAEHAREFVMGEIARHARAATGLFTVEVPARHKDGRDLVIEIRSAPILDTAGTVTGLRGTAHDITVRRKALSDLAESEENYRKLVATVPDIVVRTDLKGMILFANDKVLELGGYTHARDITGTSVFDFFAPEDLPRALENTRLMFERQLGPVEYTFVTRDRTRHVLEINGDVLRHPDGIPYGMVYVGRDVTQRKKADEAIRSARRQLDLLSSVTRHDILNKVSIQLGLLALAKKKAVDSPEMAAFIGKTEAAALAIREQIEFTRIYQDLGSHEPRWQDLHLTLAKIPVPPLLSVSDTCAGIEILADLMLEKVFGNLIDNAIRHGGNVTEVSLTAEEAGGALIIRFGDNGIGIPKDEKERIFERGFGKNTGLGLFLVREVLALTGITIHETGEPGTGARFEMVVPAGAWRIGTKPDDPK